MWKRPIHWLQTCFQICLHLVCNGHSTFCSRPISCFSQIYITLREEKPVAKCVRSAVIELDTAVVLVSYVITVLMKESSNTCRASASVCSALSLLGPADWQLYGSVLQVWHKAGTCGNNNIAPEWWFWREMSLFCCIPCTNANKVY